MNIVQLTTQDVTKALPVTTSLIIAERFDKRHDSVVRSIRELNKEAHKNVELLYCKELTVNTMTYFEMNEAFFMLLVMGFTGKKALSIKIEFIRQFQFMKKELTARQNTRHIGVAVRHSITDAIKNHVADGSNFKKFAYGNYTKLVYKRVLGSDVKKSKEARGLKESDNLRDFLTIAELEKVQALESKIAAFIEVSDTTGKDDKQIYQMVKEWLDSTN